ncbi:MAG: hypothetical protein GQ544_08915 [Candidatus Aminicenantes bacterium]|nr:hypothetical protein [Candidatus Aminicenantes bacterium]
MNKCEFEAQIDGYLLNKLSEKQAEKFENHYFNCSSCFQLMVERDEVIAAVKLKGEQIFNGLESTNQTDHHPWTERLVGFFSPKQWAAVSLSAALLLVVVLGVIPQFKSSSPRFQLDDTIMRGKTLTLISDAIPAQFRWEDLGEDVDYKITIDNHVQLWTATTANTYVTIPEKIKARMKPGVKYFWQVKAFAKEGSLIAESSKVQFSLSD